jgi:hypothetical protein
MGSKQTCWKVRTVAVVLQFVFLFPLVHNPVHFLFVEHFHYKNISTQSVEKYHKTCSLDDLSIGESSDIEPIVSNFFVFFESQFRPSERTEIPISNQVLGFLLRAPPFSSF